VTCTGRRQVLEFKGLHTEEVTRVHAYRTLAALRQHTSQQPQGNNLKGCSRERTAQSCPICFVACEDVCSLSSAAQRTCTPTSPLRAKVVSMLEKAAPGLATGTVIRNQETRPNCITLVMLVCTQMVGDTHLHADQSAQGKGGEHVGEGSARAGDAKQQQTAAARRQPRRALLEQLWGGAEGSDVRVCACVFVCAFVSFLCTVPTFV
jgi:hypothetical protein